MKHKKLLAFFSAALLLLFAGCDYVDLKSGATVFLTVETTVAEYSVDSSYGEVSGSSGNFTISVPDKRDFLISVSAEGYATASLPVTVADLKSGSYEKTLHFGDALKKELSVEFSGVKSGCKLIAGEKEFTGKGSKVTAEFTREELARGITATAEGAEPKKITFTQAQLESSYLSASVRLVEEGYKLITVKNADSQTFALDDENNLLPIEIENYNDYDEYGHYVYMSTGYLSLPLSYTGVIRMRKVYNVSTLRISVVPSSDPYDSRYEYDYDFGDSSYNTGSVYTQLVTGFADTDFNSYDYGYNFYFETETAITTAWGNYGDYWDNFGNNLGKKYTLTSWIPEGDTPAKVYFISNTVDENYVSTEHWSVADYKEGLRLSDFKECSPIVAQYGMIKDRTFGGLYTDSCYWRHWSSNSRTSVVFDKNGKFPLRSNEELFANLGEYGTYIGSDYNMPYLKTGGAWCRNYYIEGYVTYRLTVKGEDGKLITGAEVTCKDIPFEEVGGGVYLLEYNSLASGKFEVVKNGVTFYGEASADPADNSFWTRAQSGREVRGELIVTRKVMLVIALSRSWNSGDPSISNVSISDVKSGCKLTKILNDYSMVYYLLEAEAGEITFTVSYRYRSGMNWDYGDINSYVSESRRITVTLDELLNSRENDKLNVFDSYTQIFLDRFSFA